MKFKVPPVRLWVLPILLSLFTYILFYNWHVSRGHSLPYALEDAADHEHIIKYWHEAAWQLSLAVFCGSILVSAIIYNLVHSEKRKSKLDESGSNIFGMREERYVSTQRRGENLSSLLGAIVVVVVMVFSISMCSNLSKESGAQTREGLQTPHIAP